MAFAAVKAIFNFAMTATETLATLGAGSQKVAHGDYDQKFTLNGTTTPAVSMVSEFVISSSGSGTIDFTSLTTTEGTRTAVPLKLKGLRIVNTGTNVFSISAGASNGYAIGGVAIKCQPKTSTTPGVTQIFFGDALTVSSSSAKTLDYTYNSADTAYVTLIFG